VAAMRAGPLGLSIHRPALAPGGQLAREAPREESSRDGDLTMQPRRRRTVREAFSFYSRLPFWYLRAALRARVPAHREPPLPGLRGLQSIGANHLARTAGPRGTAAVRIGLIPFDGGARSKDAAYILTEDQCREEKDRQTGLSPSATFTTADDGEFRRHRTSARRHRGAPDRLVLAVPPPSILESLTRGREAIGLLIVFWRRRLMGFGRRLHISDRARQQL
jgi:hypothetical protein